MGATDAMLARLSAELEEKRILQDTLVDTAQSEGRDLKAEEAELYERASDRMKVIEGQLAPLREGVRIAADSARKTAEVTEALALARNPDLRPRAVEYRSAGEFVVDYWRGSIGDGEARERLGLYLRTAAHQTTSDNLGVIPEPVVGPVLDLVDANRPIVDTLGPRPVPGGRFIRPRVTQHTDVAVQSAEKAELVSRKMLIERVPVTMSTYGGYVNVSRQDIDFSAPQIMDLVIADLASEYAIETEAFVAAQLVLGATGVTPVISASSTPAEIIASVWKAAAAIYAATKGKGTVVVAASADMMAAIGPLFPSVNPTNAQSAGFTASGIGTGAPVGAIAGIPVVMSPGLAAGTVIAYSTAAAEVYEQRLGALQVTEPSVLGVQVAYAGYFALAEIIPTGILELTTTA